MKTQIVIARYNENIEWLKQLNSDVFDIIIYNKGSDINTDLKCNIVNLKNTGRESHTYLYHIILNYDNLPEKIIFTQANPFDHVGNNFIKDINNFEKNMNGFFYFTKNLLKIQYEDNKNKFIESGILNGTMWVNYHEISSPTFCVIEQLFGSFIKNELNIQFGPGAIFGVNKQTILNKDKEFYLKCIDILNNSSNLINPPEGHAFERLWFYILEDLS
jgi:hypothetical protein